MKVVNLHIADGITDTELLNALDGNALAVYLKNIFDIKQLALDNDRVIIYVPDDLVKMFNKSFIETLLYDVAKLTSDEPTFRLRFMLLPEDNNVALLESEVRDVYDKAVKHMFELKATEQLDEHTFSQEVSWLSFLTLLFYLVLLLLAPTMFFSLVDLVYWLIVNVHTTALWLYLDSFGVFLLLVYATIYHILKRKFKF